jgi:hypothetical protein
LCHDKMKIRVNIRIATIPPKNAHIWQFIIIIIIVIIFWYWSFFHQKN